MEDLPNIVWMDAMGKKESSVRVRAQGSRDIFEGFKAREGTIGAFRARTVGSVGGRATWRGGKWRKQPQDAQSGGFSPKGKGGKGSPNQGWWLGSRVNFWLWDIQQNGSNGIESMKKSFILLASLFSLHTFSTSVVEKTFLVLSISWILRLLSCNIFGNVLRCCQKNLYGILKTRDYGPFFKPFLDSSEHFVGIW